MQIAEGLYSVDGTGFVNVYVLVVAGRVVVVDTGVPGTADKIVACVRELGYAETDVGTIILTHADPDHSGSARRLRELTGAVVAIGAADAPRVEGKLPLKAARLGSEAAPRLVEEVEGYEVFSPDLLLREGDTVEGLTVMETPGHTDGSIALLHGDRFLFVGDALRGDNDGGAQPPSEAMTYDMARAWDSVRRLAQVPCDIMLPGHGKPIMPDAPGKVARLLQELHPER